MSENNEELQTFGDLWFEMPSILLPIYEMAQPQDLPVSYLLDATKYVLGFAIEFSAVLAEYKSKLAKEAYVNLILIPDMYFADDPVYRAHPEKSLHIFDSELPLEISERDTTVTLEWTPHAASFEESYNNLLDVGQIPGRWRRIYHACHSDLVRMTGKLRLAMEGGSLEFDTTKTSTRKQMKFGHPSSYVVCEYMKSTDGPVTYDDISEACVMGRGTIKKARKELLECGFVEEVKSGNKVVGILWIGSR